jgi:hypothetical protein
MESLRHGAFDSTTPSGDRADMFACIRCYFVHQGSIRELARWVEADFAELIGAQPGFVAYVFVDCGHREYVTISVFRQAEEAEGSRHLAPQWGEEHMTDYELTVTAAMHGQVVVGQPGDRRCARPSAGRSSAVREHALLSAA